MDVNRPENSDVQQQYDIKGFPTLLYFENGNMKFAYGGETNKDGIIKWINDPHPPKKADEAAASGGEEAAWADTDTDVVHLTNATFDTFLAEHASVLVMFYAPWCGHCKAMKPAYEKAAAFLKENNIQGTLAAVDSTKEPELGKRYDVQGFPTVKYFKDGQFAWNFDGRTEEKILEFMKNPSEPPPPPPPEMPWSEETDSPVLHLTDDSFRAELKKKKHALVMFYAPWCGHCKSAKPHFSAAATKFADDTKVVFAAVDCTVSKVTCDEWGVQGFPTLVYLSYAKNKQDYNGGRQEADFITFMNRQSGNTVSTGKAATEDHSTKEAAADFWAGVGGGNVRQLTDTTFDGVVAGARHALVMFYAPWCGHCKSSKPAFAAAADQLKDNADLLYAAVDCTANTAKCAAEEVKGYPTFRLYVGGVFKERYQGARDTAAFVAALQPPATDKKKTEL